MSQWLVSVDVVEFGFRVACCDRFKHNLAGSRQSAVLSESLACLSGYFSNSKQLYIYNIHF